MTIIKNPINLDRTESADAIDKITRFFLLGSVKNL